MAHVTPAVPARDRWLALGLVVALVLLALVRIGLGGWAPLAPDDARYLYVGLSVFDGHGPINPNGAIFLLRSPAYGLFLATGSTLLGGDPLVGARIVALVLSLLGLAGALRLGWLLAGLGGATGTAIALVATAIVWRLLPSLRIDLPQTALIVAMLLAVLRPTTRRWAVGGVLLGVAILVKETAVPLLLLPIALIGLTPPRRIARLTIVFLGAAVATAAWWWVVVWISTGQLFPLNALSVLEARDVATPLRLGRSALPVLVATLAGWGVIAWQGRRDMTSRLLLVTGLGLVPTAAYAASLGLNARNFAGLAVLSAVAVGVAGAWLVAVVRDRLRSRSAGEGGTGRTRRAGAAIALGGLLLFAVAAPVIGQRDAGRGVTDRLSDELADWLATNVQPGGRIVMAFREREAMALRRFGQADVAVLPIARVDPAEAPATYLWMGLRDRQLFGYRRAAWTAALTEPAPDVLVLVGPHPFTPAELITSTRTAKDLGLTLAAGMREGSDWIQIHRVDAVAAETGATAVPLHLSAVAAAAWLDLAGNDGTDQLLAARPVVSGDESAIRDLIERLGEAACVSPDEDSSLRLGAAGSCPG